MQIYNLDFNINLLRSILWQYNDAEHLQALINAEAEFYSLSSAGFWQNWYRDVFNLDTANDFGLIIWSVILGSYRDVRLNTESRGRIFGFNAKEGVALANSNQNFNFGNFTSSESIVSVNRDQLRMLLKIRAMQLVSNGSAYDINRMLNRVFPDNSVFCRDNLDMTMTYVFTEAPSMDILFLLQKAEVFRPPAAIGYNVRVFSARTWGFGAHRMNFHRGNFFHLNLNF